MYKKNKYENEDQQEQPRNQITNGLTKVQRGQTTHFHSLSFLTRIWANKKDQYRPANRLEGDSNDPPPLLRILRFRICLITF